MGSFMDEVNEYVEKIRKMPPPYIDLTVPDIFIYLRVKVRLTEDDYSVEPDDTPERMDRLEEALRDLNLVLVNIARYLDANIKWQESYEKELLSLKEEISEMKDQYIKQVNIQRH